QSANRFPRAPMRASGLPKPLMDRPYPGSGTGCVRYVRVARRLDDHAVAQHVAARESRGRAPEIEPEAAEIVFAEAAHDLLAIAVEVLRPLHQRQHVTL